MSAGPLIRDSVQVRWRDLLDTHLHHVERERSNEVTEDKILPVIDQTDLGSDLAMYDVPLSQINDTVQFTGGHKLTRCPPLTWIWRSSLS